MTKSSAPPSSLSSVKKAPPQVEAPIAPRQRGKTSPETPQSLLDELRKLAETRVAQEKDKK